MGLEKFSGALSRVEAADAAVGIGKLAALRDAVGRFVKPGMSVHVGVTHVFPYAACNEVARQFWGKNPGFTVYTLGAVQHMIIWMHGGLVKKLVTSYCGDIYPAPGPNPVFNDAYLSGSTQIENWSVLTYTLRLFAAATGMQAIPTRSLLGSTMEEDNAGSMRISGDDGGRRLAMLHPARPDISIFHAWAADPQGNALFAPPYSENLWGAMAARDGAIITAERIVDTDFIRRHSAFAKLPGRYVRAVVHAPFGAHPGGYHPNIIEGCRGYAEDYDFIVEFRRSSRKPERLKAWLDEWVLGITGHEDYVEKLGAGRLEKLMGRASPDSWKSELAELSAGVPEDPAWTGAEFMTVAASRFLAARIRESGCDMILAGQGSANLAAWMASYRLRSEGVPCDLVAETGFFGYSPRPGNPFLFNFANVPSCTMLTDVIGTLGCLVGGSGGRTIGSLSAAQVDSLGNINSTLIPGAFYLVGSGGANDVASTASEVVVTLPMSPMRLPEKVPYITAPGRAVSAIVTDRCVLARRDGRFVLASVLPRHGEAIDVAALVAGAREQCGWDLAVSDSVSVEAPPSMDELMTVRAFDPRRAFTA